MNDGKNALNVDSMHMLCTLGGKEEKLCDKIKEIGEKCTSVEHEDRCEYTAKVTECLKKAGADAGIKKEDFQ